MSPGASARPGSITIMNDDHTVERAVALAQQAIDLLMRAETAPASPVAGVLTAKRRRALRRDAARLRRGETEPRYKNLHSAEELADLYERTARRDEIFEQTVKELNRIARELARALKEKPPGLDEAMKALVVEAKRLAEEHGPGSEAARRYRHVLGLAWIGHERHLDTRRRKASAPPRIFLGPDPSAQARLEASAAEILTSPPSPGEMVIAIPPHDSDSGRGRLLLRIGTGKASWIGSFERGRTKGYTVRMLPDGEHLFVCAEGAGYILDAKSRTLVETIGREVVGVLRDEPFTLYIVIHNGQSLEAFGRTGRLWKTHTLSSGGFRHLNMTDDALVGEARHPILLRWVRFSVNLENGEVEIDWR